MRLEGRRRKKRTTSVVRLCGGLREEEGRGGGSEEFEDARHEHRSAHKGYEVITTPDPSPGRPL